MLAVLIVGSFSSYSYVQAEQAEYSGIACFIMFLIGNAFSILTSLLVLFNVKSNPAILKSFWFFSSLFLNIIGCYVVIHWLRNGINGVPIVLVVIYALIPVLVALQIFHFARQFSNLIKPNL